MATSTSVDGTRLVPTLLCVSMSVRLVSILQIVNPQATFQQHFDATIAVSFFLFFIKQSLQSLGLRQCSRQPSATGADPPVCSQSLTLNGPKLLPAFRPFWSETISPASGAAKTNTKQARKTHGIFIFSLAFCLQHLYWCWSSGGNRSKHSPECRPGLLLQALQKNSFPSASFCFSYKQHVS